MLVKAQARGLVSEARATAFAGLLGEMAITVDPSTASRALGDSLQLARRFKLSSYDVSYLELALREGLPLATLDADLQKRDDAGRRHGGGIIKLACAPRQGAPEKRYQLPQ